MYNIYKNSSQVINFPRRKYTNRGGKGGHITWNSLKTKSNLLFTFVGLSGGIQSRWSVVRSDHFDVVNVLFFPVERYQRGYVTGVWVNGEVLAIVGQLVRDAVVGQRGVGIDGPDLHDRCASRLVFQNGTRYDLGKHGYVVVNVF